MGIFKNFLIYMVRSYQHGNSWKRRIKKYLSELNVSGELIRIHYHELHPNDETIVLVIKVNLRSQTIWGNVSE